MCKATDDSNKKEILVETVNTNREMKVGEERGAEENKAWPA